MSQQEKELYEFGPFRLDVGEHLFERSDGASNGSLPEKAFQTLCHLVRNRGRLLTKQELLDHVWPDSFVEENNLDKCIHAIRHALGEKPGEQKYIETVRKHGYRFIAEIANSRPALSADSLSKDSDAATFLVQMFDGHDQKRLQLFAANPDLKKASDHIKAGSYAKSRDYSEKCLKNFHLSGDWAGTAEAYRYMALSHFWEGNCVKSLEYFELGIEAVEEHAAPDILCRIYTSMAGALCFLRRPNDAGTYLKKAVGLSDPNEPTRDMMLALNNLGCLQTLIGDWTTAEKTLNAALELAKKLNVGATNVLDSLAELKMLKGEYDEAQQLLERAISTAKEQKREMSAVPAMRNLARCLLAQRKFKEASAKADETIAVCRALGEKRHSDIALLVLAESCLYQGGLKECESYLRTIEKSDLTYYFFVLGSIQRIRGLAALEVGDRDLAVQHFSRSRSIFEKASDVFNTALADYLIGTNLALSQKEMASKHLTSAANVFTKLGVAFYTEAIAEKKRHLELA